MGLMKCMLVLSTFVFTLSAFAQEAERPKQLDSLNFLEGKFILDPTIKSEDQSTVVGQWTLMKQHMRVEMSGTIMGMKMEGMMMVSWDAAAQKYSATWFDSMGGGAITGTGEMKGDVLTTLTPVIDLMGQKARIRTIFTKKKDGFNMNVAMGDGDKYETFVDNTYIRAK